jgi:hypothetical protein
MLMDFIIGAATGVVSILFLKKNTRETKNKATQTDPPYKQTEPIKIQKGIPYLRDFWSNELKK